MRIAIRAGGATLLGDLFGSISIALDKPFKVGDMLQSTTSTAAWRRSASRARGLRSVTGEQVIISNADILRSRVRNMGRAEEKRVLFRLQVAYENDPAAVDQVTDVVREVIEAVPGARFVQCPLIALGQYAMEFEPMYFVAVLTDVKHGEVVDRVNRGIVREFMARGIRFAYPSQRLVMEAAGAPGQAAVSPPQDTAAKSSL